MSRILELAKEVDKEIDNLHHETDYLMSELDRERRKRKNILEKLQSLIEEELNSEYE